MADAREEFDVFCSGWEIDPCNAKQALLSYRELLGSFPGVSLDYKCRPGVSYSLRARGAAQANREMFVMVDVVDDEPENRWLSICFYADLVSDPEEKGDIAPEGLGGEDACCFNYDEEDEAMKGYIAERLKEAATAATSVGAK